MHVRESIEFVITKLTDETIITLFLLSGTMGLIVVALWLYNRRKFHQMSHEIPADVVKNYLDSIIQNSTALKSSLFRGGGLDVKDGVPSVMSTSDLPVSGVSVDSGNGEEIAQKNAEISALRQQLKDRDQSINELNDKISELSNRPAESGTDNSEELDGLRAENSSLRDQLEKALAQSSETSGGADSDLSAQLEAVTKERDELKERLQEYEIIEEDLANLKRLQQENEQLKKSLEQAGGAAPVEQAPESESEPEPAPELEPASEPEPVEEAQAAPEPEAPEATDDDDDDEDLEAAMAAAIQESSAPEAISEEEEAPAEEAQAAPEEKKKEAKAEDQKSAEELLSEFEKMLG